MTAPLLFSAHPTLPAPGTEAAWGRLIGASLALATAEFARSVDRPILLLAEDPRHADQLEAERCFMSAVEIAAHQKARSWELRATTSLARHWQEQGRLVEAHERLEQVLSWFTEGFETGDLREAKALLDELSRTV